MSKPAFQPKDNIVIKIKYFCYYGVSVRQAEKCKSEKKRGIRCWAWNQNYLVMPVMMHMDFKLQHPTTLTRRCGRLQKSVWWNMHDCPPFVCKRLGLCLCLRRKSRCHNVCAEQLIKMVKVNEKAGNFAQLFCLLHSHIQCDASQIRLVCKMKLSDKRGSEDMRGQERHFQD